MIILLKILGTAVITSAFLIIVKCIIELIKLNNK
jgi:hypothetical protein